MVLNYNSKINKKLKVIKHNIQMSNEFGLKSGNLISGNSLIKEFESYPLDNYIKKSFY